MLKPFYGYPPEWRSFDTLANEGGRGYPLQRRKELVATLRRQYEGIPDAKAVHQGIDQLGREDCFTVVTGHQLNLFTGPLFFFYKVLACINTAEELSRRIPGKKFVPVYWMATEDHDFEEINHFDLGGEKVVWARAAAGAVGRMDTTGLNEVAQRLDQLLGPGRFGDQLRSLFERAYLREDSLASAHRRLVHELFGTYGLVCLDGDDPALKRMALPVFERDIREGISYRCSRTDSESLTQLSANYSSQAHPREVNFFYLTDGRRERFVRKEGVYQLTQGNERWDLESLIEELHTHPERFSPNVIMRPAYQEVVLPNLAYIGGGGELAYWMQLKRSFEEHGLAYPLLLLRPSLLLVEQKIMRKMRRIGLDPRDMFLERDALIGKRVREISEVDMDFSPLEQTLQSQFIYLYQLAEQTDPSFLKAVRAQEVKQLKGLEKLEKRLLNAQKRKLGSEVDRVAALKDHLFPSGSLQERKLNFSEYYQMMGPDLIPFLKERIDPLPEYFRVEALPV